MNGLIIMIGILGLAKLNNRREGRKNVNKRISRLFVNKISNMVFYYSVYQKNLK